MRAPRYLLAFLFGALSCDTVPTEPVYGSGIVITPTETLVWSDDSLRLTAHQIGFKHKGPVVFKVSDTSLAQIDEDGLLRTRGNTGGDTIPLTVLAREGSYSAKSLVYLVPSSVATIDLTTDSLTIVSGDTTGTLTAVLRDKYGRVLSGRAITLIPRTPELKSNSESMRVASNFRSGSDTTKTYVIATAEGVSDSVLVVVTPQSVARIEVDSISVRSEDSTQVTWRTFDGLGRSLTGRSARITSLDPTIALTSASGFVIGTAYPDTTTRIGRIVVEVEGISGFRSVRVDPALAVSSKLSIAMGRHEPGDTVAYSLTLRSKSGVSLTNRRVEISSEDASILEIAAQGQIARATLHPDTTTRSVKLRACHESLCDSTQIVITPSTIASLSVTQGNLRIVAGEAAMMSVEVLDRYRSRLVNRRVNWTVTDTAVATTDAAGQVRGQGFGATVLSARADTASTSVKVIVEAMPRSTGLPIVWINAEKAIGDRETWINSTIAVGDSASSALRMSAQMRGRGNTTWAMPKKPYRIRLRAEASVLGLEPARNLVLLANFGDKSLMRNALALSLGKRLGVPFAHDQRFVDVFLDGEYIGNYLLTEQNEVHPSRVAITTVTATQVRSGLAQGGYYLESDEREEEIPRFRSAALNLSLAISAPSSVATTDVVTYVKQDFDRIEAALCTDDMSRSITQVDSLIDVESFISTYWINELFKNTDFWRSSTYLFRPLNERLAMGPVWDFDVSSGNSVDDPEATNPIGWHAMGRGLLACLNAQPAFNDRIASGWRDIRTRVIPAWLEELDRLESLLAPSADLNFTRWPILEEWVWPNSVVYGSYAGEVAALRSWLLARIEWIDSQVR